MIYELSMREWDAVIKRKYVDYFVPKFVVYKTTNVRNILYIWFI
jgi:hypothetical protein